MDNSWSPIYLNKWSLLVSLLKEELSCVPVWVKCYDMVAYTLDRLSLIASKISTPLMLDSYTCFMCLESWSRSSYARILIEIDARNDFCDIMVIVVPWVKCYDMVAYTLDRLSLIASKISTPLILDSYTCFMCLESWSRSSYARILIEIDARN
nr:hypothetical protein [Tanacetum cinerariifolium]